MTSRDRETIGWGVTLFLAACAALLAWGYLLLLVLAVRHGVVR